MKRWPLNKAHLWETAPFLRLLPPLVAGIIFYPADGIGSFSLWLALIVVATLFTFIIASLAQRQNNFTKLVTFTGLCTCLVFTAWLACYYYDARNDKHWMGNSLEQAEAYVARISRPAVEKEKTWKLELDITHWVAGDKVQPAEGKAFMYLFKYDAPALHEGDIIIVPNKWRRIKNRGNPYEHNYAAYMARENIYYQQFLQGREVIIHQYADEQSLPWVRQVHQWCSRQLEWYITDRATLGLLKAMLFDDRDMLEGDLADAYAQTGIVHIIAISGGHISIFFVLVAFLFGWIRHRKYRWIRYIAAIPLIWIYVVVAGAPPSAVRAAMMFSILGIGFALQKTPNGINQLLAAAFMLLCANPMWLYSIGFQLSFVAVLSIMIFYRPVYKWWSPVNRVARTIWATVAVSIAAEILVAPLVIYYFHLFPLQFIVANVLAYFFMGTVLVLGMLLIAVSPVYAVAGFIGKVVMLLVQWFNELVYDLQHLNMDSFHRLTLTGPQLVLVYIAIAGLSVFFMKKNKTALFFGLSGLAVFVALSGIERWKTLQQEMLIVYNAGKDSRVELISGTTATILYGRDSVSEATKKFVLEPAHINLHISTVQRAEEKYNLVRVGGKTVFILDKPIKDTLISADYVVLTGKYNDLPAIQETFTGAAIVLGSNISAQKAEAIKNTAREMGLQLYDAREDGAFVLQ